MFPWSAWPGLWSRFTELHADRGSGAFRAVAKSTELFFSAISTVHKPEPETLKPPEV